MSARKRKRHYEATVEELKATEGRLPLSVIITTFNEEINVVDCLESVLWADEILLVDSYSTDRTVELARQFPVRILQRRYYGSAAQKNWSLDRISNDWVLILDADERVPESLAREILELLIDGPAESSLVVLATLRCGKDVLLGWPDQAGQDDALSV